MTALPDPLELRAVSAGYTASDIIRSVTLTAARGRVTTIAGPNGAGKSTLMKTLACLLRPRVGQILIDGLKKFGEQFDKTSMFFRGEVFACGHGFGEDGGDFLRSLGVIEILANVFDLAAPRTAFLTPLRGHAIV